MGDPLLVPLADGRVGVELVVISKAAPLDVLVHAAELVVVVDEGEDELEVELAGLVDDVVEHLEAVGSVVEGGLGAVPVVEVDAVVGAVDGVGAVLVADIEEGPGTHGVEVLGGGAGEDVVDHELRGVLEVVVVGAGDAEGLAAMEELVAGAGGEVMTAGIGRVSGGLGLEPRREQAEKADKQKGGEVPEA